MTTKKKSVKKSAANGLAKYRAFIKAKTGRFTDRLDKMEKALKSVKKQKAEATKKAMAAWKKNKKT